MSEVIPLTADIVFKYVMGAEGSASRLRALLSAVQEDAGYPALKEVSITNPFNLKQSLTDKSSIIDVRAVDQDGHRYNIEVQAQAQKAFRERTLYSCSVPKFRLRRPIGRYDAIEA
jgi:predicted transposase/invertase (TIGR01784 family)